MNTFNLNDNKKLKDVLKIYNDLIIDDIKKSVEKINSYMNIDFGKTNDNGDPS